jgi:hypothetical protein
MQRRTITIFLSSLVLTGCASTEFEPLTFAPDVMLQDPLPGMAIVYLIRAPHDNAAISVYFNSSKMALLPPNSYTVVSIQPGTYQVASAAPGTSASTTGSSSVLTVKAGERRFLYTSVHTRSSASFIFIPSASGVIPLVLPTITGSGARTWNECNELDAQGLMSSAKPVPPEPGAA